MRRGEAGGNVLGTRRLDEAALIGKSGVNGDWLVAAAAYDTGLATDRRSRSLFAGWRVVASLCCAWFVSMAFLGVPARVGFRDLVVSVSYIPISSWEAGLGILRRLH